MFFYRELGMSQEDLLFSSPLATLSESFEYSENWSDTISNAEYPNTFTGFNSPLTTLSEEFNVSDGWSAP